MNRRLLIALSILLASAAGARGEDEGEDFPGPPFPPKTSISHRVPFYAPAGHPDEATARAWCSGMTDAGNARRGTRLGGDMLLAAAHALYHRVKDREQAHPLFAAAVAAYPGGDPTRALALYEMARREVWRGNFPVAKSALARLESWERVRWPRRMSDEDRRRWSALAEVVELGVPVLRADVLEGHGRRAEAAAEIEKLADNIAITEHKRARLWERAARLYDRAGEKDAALHAADRLIEATPEGSERTQWMVWRVYARHGLLTEDGAFGPTGAKAGDAFYDELLKTARDRSGYGGMGAIYLAMGSTAFVGRRKAIALEIYLLALKDPTFVEEARIHSGLWRGALLAVGLAARMGRFEEAEHLLGIIERIADQPIENVAVFREGIENARNELRERKRVRPAPPPKSAAPAKPRLEPLGRIESGDEAPEDEPDSAPKESEGGLPAWIWVLGGAIALIGLLVIARSR